MSEDKSPHPISAFFASLLNLALVIIVINVLYLWAKGREEGKPQNMTKTFAKTVKKTFVDLKEGWNYEENDSIK
jgi:hypothetical protein